MPDPYRSAAPRRPSASLAVLGVLVLAALALAIVLAAPALAEGPPSAPVNFFGRPVSPAAPLNVLVVGDSLAGPLATSMQGFARRDGMMRVTRDFRAGSGLAYPAFVNWPSRLSGLLGSVGPEVVVVSLGTNDILNMKRDGRVVYVGTPGWQQEYIDRVGYMMDLAHQGGAVVYWIGAPSMADPFRNATMILVNEAIREAASTRPWVHYVDTWPLFTDDNGEYAGDLPNRDGAWLAVRSSDGVHLTWAGTVWMATAVYEQMQRDWEGVPYEPMPIAYAPPAPAQADPTPAPTPTPQPQPQKKDKKK